ncbi:putative reverse transcriptase domain-containing protein [Tanacetum coccineum]
MYQDMKKLYWWPNMKVDIATYENVIPNSLVGTLLNVPGKMKDGVNARLDLAELGVKPKLFAMQEEDKTTQPPAANRSCNEIQVRESLAISKESVSKKKRKNSGVSVEAIDLHISKEVATTRQAFYYGVLQEIWVLDYHFRQIPLFKCDWVNHRAGGVKRDTTLGYTLVDLNNLGHKVDPFILASQAR